jgi:hypothetical protein
MNKTNVNLDLNSIDQVNKIIDMERYNGRVNLFDAPTPEIQFKMQERLAIKNKTKRDNKIRSRKCKKQRKDSAIDAF